MDVRTRHPASHQLHKISVRRALAPRREPYWGAPLERGRYVGFRKIDAERGSWIARVRDEGGRHKYKALGWVTDQFGFDEAKAAAAQWFDLQAAGVTADVISVSDACKAYVLDRRREKGEAAAHDVQIRFASRIYDDEIGARPLTKLRTAHIKAWRDSLGGSPSTANRQFTALRAALNYAVASRQVSAAVAQEWREIRPLKTAGRRRDLFLDLEQRRRLLTSCDGAIRDLIEAAMVTGARAGELTNATRAQFDARTRSMTFTGKTGTRVVPISPAAVKLFKRLARKKKPEARLLVRGDGKPWAHSDWDGLVREAAARAGLPTGTCLYSLRHSFITAALTSGMSTLDVARCCGTSLQMCQKYYGHLVADSARAKLAKLVII